MQTVMPLTFPWDKIQERLTKKKRITCCRQSWDSAEMHSHLLPLDCNKNIEIKKGFNLKKCKPLTYV